MPLLYKKFTSLFAIREYRNAKNSIVVAGSCCYMMISKASVTYIAQHLDGIMTILREQSILQIVLYKILFKHL